MKYEFSAGDEVNPLEVKRHIHVDETSVMFFKFCSWIYYVLVVINAKYILNSNKEKKLFTSGALYGFSGLLN